MDLHPGTVLHTPALTCWQTSDGLHFALDAEGPSWLSTDARGARILGLLDGHRTLAQVVAEAQLSAEPMKNLQDVMGFVHAAARAGLVSDAPFARTPYAGRAEHLGAWRLRELWLHTNDSCNLKCAHCLVSSGPEKSGGLSTEALLSAIDQAVELGAERVFFTGGEPFLRKDLFTLVDRVVAHHGREAVILTNATLVHQERLKGPLEKLDRAKVRFQVSIDGATPKDNDAVRGAGSFEKASAGLRRLASMGFQTSLTAVPSRGNLAGLPELPALAKALGAASLHLMWPHRRGRALSMLDELPGVEELLGVTRMIRERAEALGVPLDNAESLKLRANGVAFVKHDLGMAGVEALCLSSDGVLYPSAATANVEALALGRLDGRSLLEVWKSSKVALELRAASLTQNPAASGDPFRFLTGGGDLEHAYFWSGSFLGQDPWLPLISELLRDVMSELARSGRSRLNARAGFDAPVVFHAMGEGALACGDELPGSTVRAVHSNCVLAFDVERPRALVREFYGAAAETPEESLCCPVRPSAEDLKHIPKDVVDRFYGCGSPVQDAALKPGETHLDLGSGAGIDVFIAAKHVGKTGRAIGVDMTDRMLVVAEGNKPIVARNLGYDVVTFKKGFLEKVPLGDEEIDCVTSNCVVNLSPDKRAVFQEIWRVLRDHGRLVLADIVVDRAVPPHLRVNPQLWGECLSGALTEEELHAELERAGFHGIEQLKRTPWRTVDGYQFSSVTVRAYRLARKKTAPGTLDHRALYTGPFKGVTDEEGHFFPRNQSLPVSEETAIKLTHAPYAESFVVTGPDGAVLPKVKPGTPAPPKAALSCCG